jgi:hypothetical protein
MQSGSDMENSWIMVNHVKQLNDKAMMACYAYNNKDSKISTTTYYDMQPKDVVVHILFWKNLNAIMT